MAALSAVLLATPLWGQRGGRGGMAVGGVRGGYAGASHGGAYGGGAAHGWYRPGYAGHYPYYPGRYGYYGYRGGYGYGWYGYPWWGWYGGIGWSGDYNSYPDQSYPVYVYPPPDNSNAYVDYSQQEQINQLNDEVARLRAEQQSSAATRPPPKPQIQAATVLVFRDRHSEEIENYAIVGKTLWVFSEQRARKIPIAELNVPATTKANEDRGIDFRLPGQ